jgi:hypothetical protein
MNMALINFFDLCFSKKRLKETGGFSKIPGNISRIIRRPAVRVIEKALISSVIHKYI